MSDSVPGAEEERGARVPWDQRFAESLARESWLKANRPEELRPEAPLRERIRSPWFWIGVAPFIAWVVIVETAQPKGWAFAGILCALVALAWLLGFVERRTRRRARP